MADSGAYGSAFNKNKITISEHICNIFNEGELVENSVVRKFRTTAAYGKSYDTAFYNLDVIISLGYRVKSRQGTMLFGKDYFDELLVRIQEIRASERRFYQKITDIYAQTIIDYDAQSDITLAFYKTV